MLPPQTAQTLEQRLEQLLAKFDARPDTSAVQFAVASPSRNWSWSWPASPAPFFIASTTKLFVTAILGQLRNEGRIDFDEPVAPYLPDALTDGIHILKRVDSSKEITIRQMMAHTSGLADYFEQRDKKGRSHLERILKEDMAWTVEDVVDITRRLKAKFPPDSRARAFYSDTNYQLLGALIEAVEEAPVSEVMNQRIIQPLGLKDTYLFSERDIPAYDTIASMLFGKKPIIIPKAMASFQADGGIVSTAPECIRFLQAFMDGSLFPTSYFKELLSDWHSVFGPLEYGTGIMRYKLPRIFSPFQPVPPMIGHSGASGTVLFYAPELDLYVSGTLNQIKKRGLSFQLMTRVVVLCQKLFESE